MTTVILIPNEHISRDEHPELCEKADDAYCKAISDHLNTNILFEDFDFENDATVEFTQETGNLVANVKFNKPVDMKLMPACVEYTMLGSLYFDDDEEAVWRLMCLAQDAAGNTEVSY